MYRRLPPSATASMRDEEDDDGRRAPDTRSYTLRWWALVCAISAIINVTLTVLFAIVPPTSPRVPSPISVKDIIHLRRPSHFIRFDELSRPSPIVPVNFTNHPFTVAQIDQAQDTKIFPIDPRRRMVRLGTISPDDQRILVTKSISTVFQFRAVDWGMEICELRLSLPPTTIKHLILPAQSFPLSLYRLDSRTPIDITALSHRTRPSRLAKIADIPLSYGEGTLWHRKFHCQIEEVLTFELSCSEVSQDSACFMEWWQDSVTDDPDPGVWIVQHATA